MEIENFIEKLNIKLVNEKDHKINYSYLEMKDVEQKDNYLELPKVSGDD